MKPMVVVTFRLKLTMLVSQMCIWNGFKVIGNGIKDAGTEIKTLF